MPVFNNYTREGKFINSVEEPLNEQNLGRFISEHGEAAAKIYMQAIADFTREIEDIAYPKTGKYCPAQPYAMRTKIFQFHAHKETLINFSKTLLGTDTGENSTSPKSETIIQP